MSERFHDVVTQTSLVKRIQQAQNNEDWASFVETYAPIIYRFALWKGLQQVDAHDGAQEIFLRIRREIHRYDPAKGRFRTWLYVLTKNLIVDFLRYGKWRSSHDESEPESEADYQSTEEKADDDLTVWQGEFHRQLFDRALQLAREQHQAKPHEIEVMRIWLEEREQTATGKEQWIEVAQSKLSLTYAQVTQAKHAMLKLLAPILLDLAEETPLALLS